MNQSKKLDIGCQSRKVLQNRIRVRPVGLGGDLGLRTVWLCLYLI